MYLEVKLHGYVLINSLSSAQNGTFIFSVSLNKNKAAMVGSFRPSLQDLRCCLEPYINNSLLFLNNHFKITN